MTARPADHVSDATGEIAQHLEMDARRWPQAQVLDTAVAPAEAAEAVVRSWRALAEQA